MKKIKDLYTTWALGDTRSDRSKYWLTPVFIKSQIALFALNHGNQQMRVFKAVTDYKEELLQIYVQNQCNALFTDDFEILTYIFAHYHTINVYSAKSLTLDLAQSSSLMGAAYDLDKICNFLQLNQKEFPLFATLR